MTTREEHLDWCKTRALEYVDRGDLENAYLSMASDLSKHPETDGHLGIMAMIIQYNGGNLNTDSQMRKFINGFN